MQPLRTARLPPAQLSQQLFQERAMRQLLYGLIAEQDTAQRPAR